MTTNTTTHIPTNADIWHEAGMVQLGIIGTGIAIIVLAGIVFALRESDWLSDVRYWIWETAQTVASRRARRRYMREMGY